MTNRDRYLMNILLGKLFSLKTESGHLLRSAFGLQVAQSRLKALAH